MPLSPGTQLGVYEIVAAIGVGGMGEVYRARDAKLNRDVALKVLLEAVISDPDRAARFRREAQVLASLNHPNIAHLYGFEEGTTAFLVMELVEGPTLAELIGVGRDGLPLDHVLPIARQIAEALEAAHEQGVVHRDLKPANVKVRDDGTVKVLDFGLAKALETSSLSGTEAMNSPTLTARATQLGVILGTAAYMSPEQAKGRPVDKRADVWAFGVVLYEMLSGHRPFKGEDVSDTLAAVLRQDIVLDALPASTSARLKQLIERCLDRNVKTRLRDIGEARIELARLEAGGGDIAGPVSVVPAAVSAAPRWQRVLPWTLAAVAVAALFGSLVAWAPWRAPVQELPLRLSVDTGVDARIDLNLGAAAVISPDGKLLVLAAQGPSGQQLFLRRLDQLQATPLPGTEGATSPFFSPNGQWIGFFGGGSLKKIAVTGGAVVPLCPAGGGRGGTWADDDTIYFQPGTIGSPLMRVSSAGGTPSTVGTFAEGEAVQRWPQVLPGGKAILYTGHNAPVGWEGANLMIQPLPSGTPKLILQGAFHGRYVKSGHIVYMHEGTLFAVPFNLDTLEVTGQAGPALVGVVSSANTGGAQFSISDDGTVVYSPGNSSSAKNAIYWMDVAGVTTPLRAAEVDWLNPRFSPDGDRIALAIGEGSQSDVWIYEWARDRPTKLTIDPAVDSAPVWTLTGDRIAFASDRATKGIPNLYWQRADGSGDVQRLTQSTNAQTAVSFHPSGKYLAFDEATANQRDLMILPIDGDEAGGWRPGTPTVFLATPAAEVAPIFSPDGKWIAYMSDESGTMQTWVRPFPGPGGKQLISASGVGTWPTWSRVRNELFFLHPPTSKIMVAPWEIQDGAFLADKPKVWSPGNYLAMGTSRVYDLHPDGKRVAIAKPPDTDNVSRNKVVFVFNFFDELRRGAPVSK